MALEIDSITTPATPAQVRAKIYAIMEAVGTVTTSWKPGAVTRTLVAAAAIILSALSYLVAGIARSGFWQLASGDWLTMCARYLAGVRRHEETFASCSLTLTNSGDNVYNDNQVDEITVANTAGKTFRNKAVFSLGAHSSASVLFVADEVGSGSTSPAGTITTMVTSMAGVTCTNALAAVGRDAEGDPSLQRRCDSAAASRSLLGSREAYAHYAMYDAEGNPLLRPDGVAVDVNRVHVNHSSVTNTVTVTVAGASGPVGGTYTDPATDLGTIWVSLTNYALPTGVSLVLQTVTTVGIAGSWSLVVDDTINYTDAQLLTMAEAALANFFAEQPIGGYVVTGIRYVFREGFRSAIKAIDPKVLNVVSSGSDWTIAETQVPVSGTLSQTTVTRIRVT